MDGPGAAAVTFSFKARASERSSAASTVLFSLPMALSAASYRLQSPCVSCARSERCAPCEGLQLQTECGDGRREQRRGVAHG
jgi:hypothetical protein